MFPQAYISSWNTAPFRSQQKRELFPKPKSELAPGQYFTKVKGNDDEENYETNYVFKNRSERFHTPVDKTPSPSQYEIRPTFGDGPKFSLSPTMDPYEPDPFVPTPGPGDYETEINIEVVPKESPCFKAPAKMDPPPHESPDYTIDRSFLKDTRPQVIFSQHRTRGDQWEMLPSHETPAPGYYNPKGECGKAIQIPKSQRFKAAKKVKTAAFTHNHDGFVKRTYNTKYEQANYIIGA